MKTSALPKLEITQIPDDKKTLVCITTLLFGEGKDDSLFDRLENYYNCNKDKNINFSILGDFKDNKNQITENDAKIADYAKKRIDALNEKYRNDTGVVPCNSDACFPVVGISQTDNGFYILKIYQNFGFAKT